MTLEEAIKTAKEKRPGIDGYDEWEGGWVFGNREDSKFDGGYNHAPVIITKDGEIMSNMPSFVFSGKSGEFLGSFDF